jgi:hypothetical protein
MTGMSATQATDGVRTYLGRGDPAGRFADYYPAWVDKLAGDVTLRSRTTKLSGAVSRTAVPKIDASNEIGTPGKRRKSR